MPSFQDQVYAKLTEDATFLSLVGEYGGEPSVFLGDIAPIEIKAKAHGPFVLVPDYAMADDDTGLNLRRKNYTLRVYGVDSQATQATAHRVRQLLHRWSVSIDEGHVAGTNASGPANAPTDDPNVIGRIVTVSTLIQE